ncbi:MAG: hypothetical protein ACLSHO_02045 [Dysosmobacter sp.]
MVPYGFAGLAVILADVLRGGVDAAAGSGGSMLRLFPTVGLPPVLLGNAVSWPIYRRLRKSASRVFRQKDHLGGAERGGGTGAEKEARCKSRYRSGPDAGAGYLPTRGLFGPESSGTAPGAFHNAQDEAMLFYEDDDDES